MSGLSFDVTAALGVSLLLARPYAKAGITRSETSRTISRSRW